MTRVSRARVMEFGQFLAGIDLPDLDTLCVPAEFERLLGQLCDIGKIAQVIVTSKSALNHFDTVLTEVLRLLIALSEGRLDTPTAFGQDFTAAEIDCAKTGLIDLVDKQSALTIKELEEIAACWGIANGSGSTIRNHLESWERIQQEVTE